MKRKKYTLWDYKNIQKSEKIIRIFLLRKSDTLRLTEHHWSEIKFFKIKKHGGEKDEKFLSTLNNFNKSFIKKIKDNKKI